MHTKKTAEARCGCQSFMYIHESSFEMQHIVVVCSGEGAHVPVELVPPPSLLVRNDQGGEQDGW